MATGSDIHGHRGVRAGAGLTILVLMALVGGAGCGGGSGRAPAGPAFGRSGVVRTVLGHGSFPTAVAVQRDGSIVVAGTGEGDFQLVRYLRDGRLDRSFGEGGIARTDFGRIDSPAALALDSAGRVVVAGQSCVIYRGVATADTGGPCRFAVARYTQVGRLDRSFARGGRLVGPAGPGSFLLSALSVTADGSIFIAGGRGSSNVVRNHALVSEQPPRGVVGFLAGYTAAGLPTRGFGPSGRVDLAYGVLHGGLKAAGSGRVLLAGSTSAEPRWTVAVATYGHARLLTRWDSSRSTPGNLLGVGSVVFDGTSRIIVAAAAGPFLVLRFRRGGLDRSFGDRGMTRIRYGLISEPPIAVGDRRGRVMLAGEGMIEGSFRPILVRLTRGGRLDPAFGVNGIVRRVFGSIDASPGALAAEPDGGLVIAGQTRNGFAVARYRADGTLARRTPR